MSELKKEGEHSGEIIEATAVETVPVADVGSDLLTLLVNKDVDIAMIEKVMDLRDRDDARAARNAYTAAMAAFKADPPEIEKDAHVQYDTGKGTTAYSHATLGNVTNTINKALGEHGLSASWDTLQGDGGVKVTCTITHTMGHSESTSLKAAPDTSGSKNSIQALGSTISYLERYTILALTGLATKDMDTDGLMGEPDFITTEQAAKLTKLAEDAKQTQDDITRFLAYMKVEDLDTIPAKQFKKAEAALQAALKRSKKATK